jgi:hypothetical protein
MKCQLLIAALICLLVQLTMAIPFNPADSTSPVPHPSLNLTREVDSPASLTPGDATDNILAIDFCADAGYAKCVWEITEWNVCKDLFSEAWTTSSIIIPDNHFCQLWNEYGCQRCSANFAGSLSNIGGILITQEAGFS